MFFDVRWSCGDAGDDADDYDAPHLLPAPASGHRYHGSDDDAVDNDRHGGVVHCSSRPLSVYRRR